MSKRFESMTRSLVIALLVAGTAVERPARAVDPACKPVLDAMSKELATPSHTWSTETSAQHGGKPTTAESIHVGNAIFIQISGKWKRSPMSTEQLRQQEEENVRNAKSMVCRYLRDETVQGNVTAVYNTRAKTEVGNEEATVWIARGTGLPLRSDTDIDIGADHKMHFQIRYDYTNVRPPI